MASVIWARQARDDINAIRRFIARDSPGAAQHVVARIRVDTRRLAHFPRSGRIVSEFQHESYRELIVGAYRVFYHVSGSRVTVLTVRHAAQLLVAADLPNLPS